MRCINATLLAGLLLQTTSLTVVAQAQAKTDFSGQVITFVIGGGAGGGVDAFARTVAPYLTKYLPGTPTIKIMNMGASGGIQGVQYMGSVAAKDGTVIGTTNAGPIAEPLLGQVKVTYDLSQFRWIGSLTTGDTVCAVWHQSSIQSLDDAKKKMVPMASTGATSAPTRATLITAYLLGVKFKPVPGYDGGTALLAIERGEVEGSCTTLGSLRTTRPEWLKQGQLRPLVQVSMSKDAEFPNVPRLIDLTTDDEQRQMLEFLLLPYEFNNPIFLPPGTSNEVLDTWRAAFEKAVNDRSYLKDAQARLQRITPKGGTEIEGIVGRMLATPTSIIERVKQATDAGVTR